MSLDYDDSSFSFARPEGATVVKSVVMSRVNNSARHARPERSDGACRVVQCASERCSFVLFV